MIKGIKKTTTLILAGVAISSVIPSESANAAVQLEELDGNMESMYSYNGAYAFKGSKNKSGNSSSLYYFNGEKDAMIEDDCSDDGEKYGGKYVDFADDEMLFNLETGLEEEDNSEDKLSLIESDFKISRIKKASKYKKASKLVFKEKIKNNSWDDEWYEYRVESSDGSKSYLTFLSENSKGLDASVKLNIIHFPKDENGKYVFDKNDKIVSVGISEYKNIKSKGYTIEDEKTLFADKDFIYRIMKIKSSNEKKSYDVGNYLVKISKEKGSLSDGVYQPKSTMSYAIDDEAADDFWNEDSIFLTKGSSIYVGAFDDDKLTLKKYMLKKSKESKENIRVVEFDDEESLKNVKKTTIDKDGNLWAISQGKIEEFKDGKFETIYTCDRSFDQMSVYDEKNLTAWNTDTQVYARVCTKENITQNTDKSKTDSSSQDKKAEADKGKTTAADTSKAEADKNKTTAADTSKTEKVDTSKQNKTIEKGWIKENNNWYYLNEDGTKKSGWLKDNELWYYLQEDGVMKTGWFKDSNEKWYYLKENGSMAANETIDGYNLGQDGAWIE